MAKVPTIFALSSGPGRAAVAVIRISGPDAATVLARMAGGLPEPRQAALRRIVEPGTGAVLDHALILYFKGPASETGEDLAELQLHGGRAVVTAVLAALARLPGLRLAEPGEFVRRAFEAGKLDLTAVEGLADLIDAETERQRAQALQQASGALARLYDGWRSRLLEAAALLEAGIDFSDEADVAERVEAEAEIRVRRLHSDIAAHLADGHRGEILREGFRVVLAGAPNAGKSSLLNALARRDVAIVSDEPGTTRDVIEVRLDLVGIPVLVSDTAGLREPSGAIEREGMRRTLARAREADLMVWVVDATAPVDVPPPLDGTVALRVVNKADLTPGPAADLRVSAVTGEGLGELTKRIAQLAAERLGDAGDAAVITQARHRRLVEACAEALREFLAADPRSPELRAEDLRRASDTLGRLTGRIDVEDILGEIFGRFCIGK